MGSTATAEGNGSGTRPAPPTPGWTGWPGTRRGPRPSPPVPGPPTGRGPVAAGRRDPGRGPVAVPVLCPAETGPGGEDGAEGGDGPAPPRPSPDAHRHPGTTQDNRSAWITTAIARRGRGRPRAGRSHGPVGHVAAAGGPTGEPDGRRLRGPGNAHRAILPVPGRTRRLEDRGVPRDHVEGCPRPGWNGRPPQPGGAGAPRWCGHQGRPGVSGPGGAALPRVLGVEIWSPAPSPPPGSTRWRASCAGRTGVLLGPSGRGKSSLVNALLGVEQLATGPVRSGDHRGRHTPPPGIWSRPDRWGAHRHPGLRAFALAGDSGVGSAFPEIETLAGGCRFDDCRHDTEPGCTVTAAVAAGRLDAERLASYHKLQRELDYESRRHDPLARREAERVWKQRAKAARKLSRPR